VANFFFCNSSTYNNIALTQFSFLKLITSNKIIFCNIFFCNNFFFTFLISGFLGFAAELQFFTWQWSNLHHESVLFSLNLPQIDKFKNVSGQGPDLWSKTRYVAKGLI
jgi:hypothetical protein